MESITDVVYHFTELYGTLSILKNDRMNLLSSMSNRANNLHKEFFYMSVSRTRSTDIGYGRLQENIINIRLQLDGRKLNQLYKGQAVDYWKSKDFIEFTRQRFTDEEIKNLSPEKKEMIKKNYARQFEYEDRVLSDKESIPNFSKYIQRIDVFIPSFDNKMSDFYDETERNRKLDDIKTLIKYCKGRGIYLFITSVPNNYKHQKGENEIGKFIEMEVGDYGKDEDGYVSRDWTNVYEDYILFEVLNRFGRYPAGDNNTAKISDMVDKIIEDEGVSVSGSDKRRINNRLINSAYGMTHMNELISLIASDMHNLGANESSSRIYLEKIAKILRKYKCDSVEEYLFLMFLGRLPKGSDVVKYDLYNTEYDEKVNRNKNANDEYGFFVRSGFMPLDYKFVEELKNYYYNDEEKTVGDVLDFLSKRYVKWKLDEVVEAMGGGNYELIEHKDEEDSEF